MILCIIDEFALQTPRSVITHVALIYIYINKNKIWSEFHFQFSYQPHLHVITDGIEHIVFRASSVPMQN